MPRQINEMPVVQHDKPLTMGWCLQCRRPARELAPVNEVTNLKWKPPEGQTAGGIGARHSEGLQVKAPELPELSPMTLANPACEGGG